MRTRTKVLIGALSLALGVFIYVNREAAAAGSAMTITYEEPNLTEINAGRTIGRILVSWTSDDATGAVSGTTREIAGELLKAITDPGAAAPTADYDIVITDDEGFNVLTNCEDDLVDRHTTTTEEVYLGVDDNGGAAWRAPVVASTLTIAVTAAGNSKTGQVILYWRRM